jgi:4-carboxymuconolactone decarboxylase
MANSDLFLKGLEMRRAVLGDEYVAANLATADDFMMTFQPWSPSWPGGMPGRGRRWTGRRNAS